MTTSFASIMPIVKRPPIVFTRGEGHYIWDSDNNKYLDFIQGWAVNCLGHCPPVLAQAIAAQAQTLINCSPAYYNAPMLELSDLLAAKSGFEHVFFANSGAEANEGAIKLARKWGQLHKDGAYKIISMDHGFHGRTLATMSASGKAGWDTLFEPKVPGFYKVPLNDIAAVEAAITPQTVAVLLEPIQGEAGVFVAEDDYLRQLRQLTKKHNILLIVDEVQTGVGRTGALFAFAHAGITPDIMTLGKGLGGGAPIAALLAQKDVSCFAPGDQGGTFNGNALMTAAALAVLKTVSAEGFLENVVAQEKYLREKLAALADKHRFGEVRGRGLLLALDLKREIGVEMAAAALNKGLLINAPRPDTLRFVPALNIGKEQIDAMIEILDEVAGELQ
jgi:acetylornithine/N-succinyldiaminopimelate aminotransferase